MTNESLNRWWRLLLVVVLWVGSTNVLAQTDTFTAGSGLWGTGSNWSLQQPPGQGNDCVIPQNSTVSIIDFSGACNSYDMETGTTVTAPSNTSGYLDVYGPTFINKGTLNILSVNGIAFFGNGTQTISGGGTINILNHGIGESPTSTLVNMDNSIHGASDIYINQLTNHALIDANVLSTQLTLQSSSPGVTNTGTIQASNGGLLVLSGGGFTPPFNNTGGIIQALDGSTVQFGGYSLRGGILATSGTGVLQNINSSFFSNFTNNGNFQVLNASSTILGGTVTNNGTFTAANGGFYANGVTTLKGSGTITGGNGNFVHGWTTGSTLTVQEPISGGGTIGDTNLIFTNQSTVTANNPSANLVLTGGNAEINVGTLQASNGGTLEIQNTINNAGGTIRALDGSKVLLNYAGTAVGGTITTSGTGVVETDTGTLDGTVNVPTNQGLITAGTLNVKGTINNNGTISLSSSGGSINLPGSATLTGSGQVEMAQGSWFSGPGNVTLTNASTISGAGNIGLGEMAIVNKGIILGNQPTPGLLISPDSAGFTNSGTLMTTAGGILNVQGTFNNFAKNTLSGGTYTIAGTLEFSNANILTNSAKITLVGAGAQIIDSGSQANALANLGANISLLSLQSGAALATNGNLTNHGTLTIGTGSSLLVGSSFTQTGGTTTVDGVFTAPAGFTLQKGKLFGAGTILASVSSSASVAAGDSPTKPAKLTVSSYAQNSTGTLNISIGGTSAGSNYGQLASSNGVSLGGTLNLTRIHGFLPKIGETFTIVTGMAMSGQFTTVNGLAINSGEHFQINYGATAVMLQVVSGP